MASDQALVEGRAAIHIRWLCINWERSPFEHLGQVTSDGTVALSATSPLALGKGACR
jgi:hypothetical protein